MKKRIKNINDYRLKDGYLSKLPDTTFQEAHPLPLTEMIVLPSLRLSTRNPHGKSSSKFNVSAICNTYKTTVFVLGLR
jgi:hypothetical protein